MSTRRHFTLWRRRHERPTRKRASLLGVGDSYTIGEAVTPSARWPNQLVEALRPTLQKETASRPPTSCNHRLDDGRFEARHGRGSAGHDGVDLVSLLIGVNNQYQGLPIEEYAQEFDALLDEAIELAGATQRACLW